MKPFPISFSLLIVVASPSLFCTNATWNVNASANWDVNGNWTPATFPNAIDDVANFSTNITANRTITLGQNITVGTVTINSTHNYMISGANTLSFQTSSGNASVSIASTNTGAPSINAATSVNLASTLSVSNAGSGSFTISGSMSGNGGLIKTGTGAGALILNSGTNSYLGTTQIQQGLVTYNVAGCIPATSAVTIGDGATAGVQLTIAAVMTAGNAFPVTIQSDGELFANTNRTVFLSSLNGSGTVSLPSGATAANLFEIVNSSTCSFSGTITGGNTSASTNPTAANRVIMNGTSTLTLSGISTYVSRTFISQGIIDLQNESGLGSAGAGSAVYVQATGTQGSLYLDGSGLNLSKTLFLNGPGFAVGALRNMNGNNTISGNIQIGWSGGPETASDATISVDSGTELFLTGLISGSNNLTLTGGGTAALEGSVNNTLSGTTTITNSSTLLLNGSGGVTLSGPANVQSGFLLLGAANQIIDTGTITLSGGTFNMQGFADTIGSLVFNSGNFLQGGATLTLSSAAATALSMNDGTSIAGNLAFSAAGGVTFTGATGTASISGNVNLGTFAHTFDIAPSTASVSMNISGIISGSGSITQSTGTGILEFSGTNANIYSGTTTIDAGTLLLNKTPGVNAIAGNVTVNGGVLELGASQQINDASTVTLSSGTFNMGSNSETISELIATLGSLSQTGSSVLTLASSTTALSMTGANLSGSIALSSTGGITTNSSATTSVLAGTLDLMSSSHTFTIAHNAAASPDADISATIISSTGGGGFTKAGVAAGVLSLTGSNANTYNGLTTVSSGTLLLNKSSGVVAIPGNVTVSGGTLQSQAAGQIATTSIMTISGGTWNMGGFAQTLDQLIFTSGTLTPGGATLTLTDNTTALTMRNTTVSAALVFQGSGDIVFDATNNGTATISNTVDLGGFTHNFNIGNGAAANDMTISGVISDGGVTLTGPGRLNFTAANIYTGLTTVSNGTLHLGTAANTFAISGDILINGGTLLNAAANQIIHTSTVTLSSGTFSLAGFAQTINTLNFYGGTSTPGGGTLSLSTLVMRNTTFTGNITMTGGGGIFFDDTNNGTATISGNININGFPTTFTIADGTAATDMLVSGVISGGGGITMTGAGTLTFDGGAANSYGGGTTVSEGTLQLSKTAGNAIPGNVLINGGTLLLGASNQIINSSIVTLSSGTFNLAGFSDTINTLNFYGGTSTPGGGTLSLSTLVMRDTTFTGNLTMTGGGGIFFDDTNNGTATISGNINLNGFSTTFDIADGTSAIDMQVSGVISNGALVKGGVGTGTLLLTGANIYAGGTTVSLGTLQGNTTSLQGSIIDDATLVFDQTGAGTFSGNISGTGNLLFQGGGMFTLSNTDSLSGLTTVNASTLVVNNAFSGAGTMVIGPGATLMGTGPITQNVTVQGTLAPGNSIGTIQLIGAQTFAPGSVLEIEINPTTSDLVDITGTLAIDPGATLDVVLDIGLYSLPTTYTITTATGGFTGTFSSFVISLPAFDAKIIYDLPNNILLELFPIPFSDMITKGNAGKVARCLDAILPPSNSDLGFITNAIRMLSTIAEMQSALDQLQPSLFTSLSIAEQDNTLDVSNAILNRLQSTDSGWNLWVTPLGGFTTNHHRNDPGFHSNTGGFVVAFDAPLGKSFCLGAGLAYTHTDFSWQEHRGKTVFQSLYPSLYARWSSRSGFLEAIYLQSFDFYDTKRKINFGADAIPVDRIARSEHDGCGSSAHLKGGYIFSSGKAHFSPYLYLAYLSLHENEFREHGAHSLDLEVRKKNSDLFFGELGIHSYYTISSGSLTVTPFVDIGVEREDRLRGKREHAILDKSCTLNVTGMYPSRTLFDTSAGISFAHRKKNPYVSLAYKGRFAPHFSDQSVYLQFLIEF